MPSRRTSLLPTHLPTCLRASQRQVATLRAQLAVAQAQAQAQVPVPVPVAVPFPPTLQPVPLPSHLAHVHVQQHHQQHLPALQAAAVASASAAAAAAAASAVTGGVTAASFLPPAVMPAAVPGETALPAHALVPLQPLQRVGSLPAAAMHSSGAAVSEPSRMAAVTGASAGEHDSSRGVAAGHTTANGDHSLASASEQGVTAMRAEAGLTGS